jgi:hypothetical protein
VSRVRPLSLAHHVDALYHSWTRSHIDFHVCDGYLCPPDESSIDARSIHVADDLVSNVRDSALDDGKSVRTTVYTSVDMENKLSGSIIFNSCLNLFAAVVSI